VAGTGCPPALTVAVIDGGGRRELAELGARDRPLHGSAVLRLGAGLKPAGRFRSVRRVH
jgi:hypothetical protein